MSCIKKKYHHAQIMKNSSEKKSQGVDLHQSKSHLLQINQKITILNSNLGPSRTYQKLNYKIQNSKYSE